MGDKNVTSPPITVSTTVTSPCVTDGCLRGASAGRGPPLPLDTVGFGSGALEEVGMLEGSPTEEIPFVQTYVWGHGR
eukprot:1388648-Amorphochlora_amoeboformis.AAC.2